jgi:hypothetical protein
MEYFGTGELSKISSISHQSLHDLFIDVLSSNL